MAMTDAPSQTNARIPKKDKRIEGKRAGALGVRGLVISCSNVGIKTANITKMKMIAPTTAVITP
jgi:hypothetical protein